MKRILVGICGVSILLVGFLLLRPHNDFASGHEGPEVEIEVVAGDTGAAIGNTLEKQGVIKAATTFIALARRDSSANRIGPGTHRIQTHLPVREALSQLLDQKRLADQVKIPEASTFADVVSLLKKSKSIDQASTLKLSKVSPFLSNSKGSLEGQIFPAHYAFAPKTTFNAALTSMVARFAQSSQVTGITRGYKQYSPYDVLKVASMVQIEGDPSDFDKVAQTIYNRLKIGMPLQLNSTVQYAAHLRGRIALSTAATQIDSPYNTYRHIGLPPTPISNPSESAVRASLHPASGDWLYFITVSPGDTRFTKQYSQFQEWEVLYHRNLNSGAFK